MPRTAPECPACAASVMAQGFPERLTTWDVADRLEATARKLDAMPGMDPRDVAHLWEAAGLLRIAEFRTPPPR